jgi:peptide/nickel transport system permease protein
LAALSRYIARRLIQGVITLFIVTIIIFLLFKAMPGNPVNFLKGNPTIPPAVIHQVAEQFGIYDSFPVQMYKFMINMFTFQFGESIQGRPVLAIIDEAMPRTLLLFGGATIIEYLLGVLVGRYIAWKRGKPVEGTVIVTSLFFYNMPSFWIGLILLFLFAFTFPIFPLRGFSDPAFVLSHYPWAGTDTRSLWFQIVDVGSHAFLPMVTLTLISAAGTILLMQTSMLEVMGEDFILTARAKGLSERAVRRRHAARNAYLPIVTSIVISIGFIVGGAIILENIFSYYGMGYYLLNAVETEDRFLAGAILFLISFLVIIGNIVADILYGVLDPRVRI